MPNDTVLPNVDTLILEGGGAKGPGHVGGVKALEERDIIRRLEVVAGSSAGAIVASIIALGGDSKTLEDFVLKEDMVALIDNAATRTFAQAMSNPGQVLSSAKAKVKGMFGHTPKSSSSTSTAST